MNTSKNLMQSLIDLPQEQTTEFLLGLSKYLDDWRSAGLEYPHILFLTMALFSKAFAAVPKETLLKAIGAAIDMQRMIDEIAENSVPAETVRARNGEKSSGFKRILEKLRSG